MPFLVRWPGHIAAGKSSDQILSLNDVFATAAGLLGKVLPEDAAEDSLSFLGSLLGKTKTPHRSHVVSHSVDGEFGYTEGHWKIVFKNEFENLRESRGKPRIVELYNLDEDIAETNSLIQQEPEIAERLSQSLRSVVRRGTSRQGPDQSNDAEVVVDVTQTLRWAPALAEE